MPLVYQPSGLSLSRRSSLQAFAVHRLSYSAVRVPLVAAMVESMATGGNLELQKIGQPGSLNICQAYESFKGALNDVGGTYQDLNPHGGRFHQAGKVMAIEPSTSGQFLRGAVISVISMWKHYVLNLFSEAFNHVVHIGDETNTCRIFHIPATTAAVATLPVRSKN